MEKVMKNVFGISKKVDSDIVYYYTIKSNPLTVGVDVPDGKCNFDTYQISIKFASETLDGIKKIDEFKPSGLDVVSFINQFDNYVMFPTNSDADVSDKLELLDGVVNVLKSRYVDIKYLGHMLYTTIQNQLGRVDLPIQIVELQIDGV